MNIIFVCTGNTCRSPMAEGYLKSLNIDGVLVSSAGLEENGAPVSENSAAVMREMGIDISLHTSRALTREDIESSDKIYVMTPTHKHFLDGVLKNFDIDGKKIEVLSEKGISDPYLSDIGVYRKCRDEIIEAINKIFGICEATVLSLDKNDAETIEKIEKACFSTPWSINSINEAIEHNNIFLGIKENETLIGYISFNCLFDECYIGNIAVLPEYRQKGVAKKLLSSAIALSIEMNAAFISLEVRESNSPAINLYKKFGFKEEGRRKNYYEHPKEDAIILTRRF